jgi:hypothetical protein
MKGILVAVLVVAVCAPAASARSLPRLSPPADGRSYFGFTFRIFDTSDPLWGDTRSFEERLQDSIHHELAGKTPTFIKVWSQWQQADLRGKPFVPFGSALGDIARVRSVIGDAGVLHLDWNLNSSAANQGITTRDVAAGQTDRYIRHFARDVREYGRPVLITLLDGEFNGSWWYGVSPRANSELTTRDFVHAWRRIVDIFRAVGAVNVSFAWVVNGYPADGSHPEIDPNISAYYPGDEYVDWVGVDVYDVGVPSWIDGPYAFAVAHGKPVFIGEFGIRHEWSPLTPPFQLSWLGAIFDYFAGHPAIKAISYFNYCNRAGATRVRWDPSQSVYIDGGKVNYVPNANDHDSRLLAGGPEVQALFAARIASERYVSTVTTLPIESNPQPAVAKLVSAQARRGVATVRWRGNYAADTYDVALRRSVGAWRLVATKRVAVTYRTRLRSGGTLYVRVRAHDVDGASGEWSKARKITVGPSS